MSHLPKIWLGDIRHDIDGYLIRLVLPLGRTKDIKTAVCDLIRDGAPLNKLEGKI